ncbi:ricin-type beta-trefoil lectin domain protein [Streptomyces hygroscopicus]|uniref:ricin-type beta-trefoil lectin domain protein n=1 Tax=Streptomyces hygroscopicus TaxID=1912 RepID=UPI00223F552D|nr:ricin-type beta-trefoil lectin domain protein [Streptomyces hygroscopicus]MCW7943324.1 ricin-type beta-trefoil lectin domain protein [Streptomyces hygroscopicus]
MARAERDDDDVETEGGMHSTVSDARLTELLRSDTPIAYPALRELRVRHRPAVLAYARLCTVDDTAARQLTAQAFALAARDTARGSDPRGPWRHQLLLLAGRVTASWATDERAPRLDAALLAHLRAAAPGASAPPMLAAFQALPVRVQGLIWYGVVEQEPSERTAGLLGLSPQDVAYGIEPAFGALRQSLLRTRLAASGNPRCQDFRRLIEESVRPGTPRHSADLHAHMAHCVHCATAYEELSQLRDTPRTALAEGLLPWGGTAYAMAEADEQSTGSAARLPGWWPSRRFVLAATAVGVALAPLLVYLLASDGSGSARAASDVITPPPPPAVTVTATVSLTPSPTPTPSPSPTTRSPSPTPTPTPSGTTRPPSPKPQPKPPAPHPPNGTYAQVVNVASGLCLDIRDGVMDDGTDVITAPCTSSGTQRWRVDASSEVLQSYADPDYCLDSRGSTYRGVGIWTCSSVDGSNGQNLRFTVDSRGVIRPEIAPDHAVTPYGGDTVFLIPDQGGDAQRWRAGAS